jgi:hypothetical protein
MPQPDNDAALDRQRPTLVVYSRRALIDAEPPDCDEALLLEGAWGLPASAGRWSLDQSIDGRFDWIDRQAEACAAELVSPLALAAEEVLSGGRSSLPPWPENPGQSPGLKRAGPAGVQPRALPGDCRPNGSVSCPTLDMCAAGEGPGVRAFEPASPSNALWLAALELRYYLVKLLRVGAFFDHVRPLTPRDRVELVAQMPRDADYVNLCEQHCRRAGAQFEVRKIPGPEAGRPPFPPNPRLRRWLGAVAEWLQPSRDARPGQSQVVLCGNPRVLDSLVVPLQERGARVWWLYDRFALRAFVAWRWHGVGQLVCNASQAIENQLQVDVPQRLEMAGVDLAPAVRQFAERWLHSHGLRQSFLARTLADHFQRLRPAAVILDEDATPWARAVVVAARAAGARSLVVQHGAPCCRFGFAPLAADEICVWGRSAQSQLLRWGVPADQVRITGSPYHDRLRRQLQRRRPKPTAQSARPRLLMFATVPPRDERPDAVAIHWTRQSYADVLQAALEGASRVGCCELLIKLHPRAGRDPILDAAIANHPRLAVRLVRRGQLHQLLRGIDCVLSCGSSAGIDATLSGIPVIQILPAGASDFLSRESWGLAGIAHTAAELERLLQEALTSAGPPRPLDPNVFGRFDVSAAERIADAALQAPPQLAPVPEPHSSFILQPSSFR